MWINADVTALMSLLREIRDELKRINEYKYRIDKQVQQVVLDVRKKKTRKTKKD